MMIRVFLLFFTLLALAPAAAQTPAIDGRAALLTELETRNVDVAELRRRLQTEGIELDALTNEQLVAARPQIEGIIREIQLEREAAAPAPEVQVTTTENGDGEGTKETSVEIVEVTQEELPESAIYGHDIFRNKSLRVYQAGENITAPDNYPLQTGDELAVTIFGASQSNFLLTVGDDGFVTFPNGLKLTLEGVTINQAKGLLERRLRQFYTFQRGQLSIIVQRTRAVAVNIFGEVESNGTYSLSSVNTAFNALVAAGGPTENGTVRNIQVIDGGNTTVIDVYDFLRNPQPSAEIFLRNGMTIFVPPSGILVELEGGVRRPLFYEMRPEEGISDLITFAGGATARAETGAIRVTRYTNGTLKTINVDLQQNPGFRLQDGDRVIVPQVENPLDEFVSVEGAVLLEGRFAYEENLTIGNLVENARLRPGARRDVAFVYRAQDDGTFALQKLNLSDGSPDLNISVRKGDRLRILTQASFLDGGEVSIAGAVRAVDTIAYPIDGGLNLEELILLSGGLQRNAADEVIVVRTPPENREERQYLRLSLTEDQQFELLPGDAVTVYSRERFTDPFEVKLGGAVRDPGTYRYDPSLGLDDLFVLAGGFTPAAALDKIDVFRLKTFDNEATQTLTTTLVVDSTFNILSSSDPDFILQPYDVLVVRRIPGFEPIRTVEVQGQVQYPGEYAIDVANMRLTDLIAKAGGITPDAFPPGGTLFRRDAQIGLIVIQLDEALSNSNIASNIVLKDGDILTVPRARDLVRINTQNTKANSIYIDSLLRRDRINIAYDGKKDAKWYVENYAAGYADDAWKRSTVVEYPNGEVKATKRFLFFNNYPDIRPGSIISVSERPERKKRERRVRTEPREKVDWGKFARDTIAIATSTISLILLVDRLD
ncbi:SLBB domain-containing protein [Lewinella sp. 4G2]|uniref:SLBB domain-containing protein n=1 Tax=Lewinella sp. 4G2 TaxID=1803372 RepID=UPI0007B49DAC|nr:SLBB domain-containing protein [Lewinella sp. 4G2]OAV44295.1 hypothetical protein A3850_007220 [Lewinella sp. 4G2]